MRTIRALIQYVKPYRWTVLLIMALIVAQVLTDLRIPQLIQRIIDEGVAVRDLQTVLRLSAWMVGLTLLSAVLAIASSILSIRVGESTARDLRKAVFRKVQAFSYGNLDHYSTGQLMVRLTSDVQGLQRTVQMTLRMGSKGPLMMIGSVLLMVRTSPELAWSVLPLFGFALGLIFFFSNRMEPSYRRVQEKLDTLNTVLQENISGAELVKAFARADREIGRFDDANVSFANSSIDVMQFLAVMTPTLTLIVNIGIVLIIWLGGGQVIAGGISLGKLIAFVNYMLAIQVPLVMMINMANNLANGLASGKRVFAMLDEPVEVMDPAEPLALPVGELGNVSFDAVDFQYELEETLKILENLSLRSEKGQVVAILGATGAGKSSLVNLIPRFYDPTAGFVRVGGVDLRQLRQSDLLASIGIVPQETVLFSGSVSDNIRFGRVDASDAEVEQAARDARAHDFIMEMPEGYDSYIEQRGANLSGGQKQRLAIARALLMNPEILILDDSTSAVDVETETFIQDNLRQRLKNQTIFIVAQRISTVLNADKIVVLEQGSIAAEGTHQDLLRTSKIYQEIFESQLGEGIS